MTEPMDETRGPALEVKDLAFAYPGGTQALFGVDLTIGRGERVALLGPNGAGKSTLVLHLNGVYRAQVGWVRVGGLPVVDEHLREVRRRVGIVFQDPDDQLFMPTVREDVAFGPANLGLRGDELEERVVEALAAVGMEAFADRAPHHLSFGQRRRVSVATVLAMRPQILVLDEPSSNLDPASRRELADILRSLDITMLMVTHDLPYALELCPRSLVMNEGRIVADGPTAEILADGPLMAANRLELPFGFFPELAEAERRRSSCAGGRRRLSARLGGAALAAAGDREVREIGFEAVVAADQLLEPAGLFERERVVLAAPSAREVHVLRVLGAVVLGPRLEVGVREHAELLEQGERAVDGRGVHPRHLALHRAGDRAGGDVALGLHHLRDDRVPLRGHTQAPRAKLLHHLVEITSRPLHDRHRSSGLQMQCNTLHMQSGTGRLPSGRWR